LKQDEETLRVQNEGAVAEIAEIEKKKQVCAQELQELDNTRKTELMKLRQKVDDEYKRQVELERGRIEKIREQEALAEKHLKERFEEIDSKWAAALSSDLSTQLWQMIADRASLFGIDHLRENPDFKKDVTEIASKTLMEEFALRRTRILETSPSPEVLFRRKHRIQLAKSFSGWAVAGVMLAFLALSVLTTPTTPQPSRTTASVIGPQAH
jgi:hypothetical protein